MGNSRQAEYIIFLSGELTSSAVGFRQSKIDQCVFYREEIIYILYTDYSIMEVTYGGWRSYIVDEIKEEGLDINEEGDIEDFLRINIYKVENDSYHLS